MFSDSSQRYARACLKLLQGRFPKRLVGHMGNSLFAVPRAQLVAPCDLVHVDGRHSYLNVVLDTLQLMNKSTPHALYLFDDQCDPIDCRLISLATAGAALGVYEMVAAGILEPITAVYQGVRKFGLYRRGTGGHVARAVQEAKRLRVSALSRLGDFVKRGGKGASSKWHFDIFPCARSSLNLTFMAVNEHRQLQLFENEFNSPNSEFPQRFRAADCTQN